MGENFKRTVTGTKDEIIAHLGDARDQRRSTYRTELLPRYVRQHALGYAEGLEFAMALLRDWQLPEPCEHAWKDCEVPCDDCGSHPGVTCEHCEATLDLIRVCDPRELARMPERKGTS